MLSTKKLLYKILERYAFENISFPAATISAGSVGTYATNVSVNIAKSGYVPIGIMTLQIVHPAAYVAVLALSGANAVVAFYRANTTSYNVPAGDVTATVMYKKA